MANVIKYKTTQPTKRGRRRGNLVVGTGDEGYGPTSTTGYVNGITPPDGGYVVYTLDGTNPNVYVADSDDDLPAIARTLGWSGEFDHLEAINYLNSQNNIWVIHNTPNNTVTDSLVLDLNTKHMSSFLDNKPLTNVATTNTWRSTWDNSGEAVWNDNDLDVQRVFSNITVHSMEKTTNGNSHLGVGYVSSLIADGVECTYSLFIYIPSSNSATMSGAAPYMRPFPANYNATYLKYNGSSAWGTWPRNKWIRIEGTATPAANGNGGISTAYISSYLNTAGDKVYYTAPQFELGSKATPFTSGSRSQNTTWYDLSGKGNNATLYNSPSFSNNKIVLDNVDDYILASFDEGVLKQSNQSGTWTIETSFIYNGNSSNNEAIIAGRSGHHAGIYMYNNDILRHAIKTDQGWTGAINTAIATLQDGKGYHTVMTYNNGTVKSYLNGEYVSTSTLDLNTYDMRIYDNTFYIGGISNRYNDISLETVKCYTNELSLSEIQQNYYGGPIVTDSLTFAMDVGNLVSHESGSTIAYSLTGSYSGSFINGPIYSQINGGAVKVDGTNDYILVNGLPTGNTWTIQLWSLIKTTQSSFSVAGHRTYAATDNFRFQWDDKSTNIAYAPLTDFVSPGGSVIGFTNKSEDDLFNKWNLVTMTCDGSNVRLYFNGDLSPNTTGARNFSSDGVMRIGIDGISGIGGTDIFNRDGGDGYFGPVMVYDKALSHSEVLQNYNAQKARFGL